MKNKLIKKTTLFTVICLYLLFTPGCESGIHQAEGPRITFSKSICDLGTLGKAVERSCEFEFSNTGTEELTIKRVISFCRCSVAELEKKVYAPGESGSIKISYTTQIAKSRPLEQQLIVFTNDPFHPEIPLTLKARVVDVVTAEPSVLEIEPGEDSNLYEPVKLISRDGSAFSIEGCRSSMGILDFDYNPGHFAKEHILQPTLNKQKLKRIGNLNGRIFFTVWHPNCRTVVSRFRLTGNKPD